MCTGLYECPLRVELLFFPVLQSNPADLESQMFWRLLLPLTDPQVGEPDVRLRTFIPVAEPPQYNYFPMCGFPTQQVLDLILSQLHPSYCLVMGSLSLDLWYLFRWVPPFLFCWWLLAVSLFWCFCEKQGSSLASTLPSPESLCTLTILNNACHTEGTQKIQVRWKKQWIVTSSEKKGKEVISDFKAWRHVRHTCYSI